MPWPRGAWSCSLATQSVDQLPTSKCLNVDSIFGCGPVMNGRCFARSVRFGTTFAVLQWRVRSLSCESVQRKRQGRHAHAPRGAWHPGCNSGHATVVRRELFCPVSDEDRPMQRRTPGESSTQFTIGTKRYRGTTSIHPAGNTIQTPDQSFESLSIVESKSQMGLIAVRAS